MKILSFMFRGQEYLVDESGRINANGIGHFSDDWIFLGGSPHHWHNRVVYNLKYVFEYPAILNGCYGWDRDHGMVRRWGGMYYGKVPRIQNAFVREAP